MGIIAAIVATIICAVFYVRMCKREIPEPISFKRAAIPVALGVLAVFINMPLSIGSLAAIAAVFGKLSDVIPSLVLRSLVASFFMAGFTEEFVKMLMFLIVIRVCKPKNVYEYGLLCAGVGFGFTGLEDAVYGIQNPVSSVFRVFFFGMHLMFGLIMGLEMGLAQYSKKNGTGGSVKHTILAMAVPVLWHTIFDASTIANAAFNAEDEAVQMIGVVVALVVCAVSIALQFVLLIQYKKNTEKLCAMSVVDEEEPVGGHFRRADAGAEA